jgi:hypothetical protein
MAVKSFKKMKLSLIFILACIEILLPIKVNALEFFNREFLPLTHETTIATYEIDYRTTAFDLRLDDKPYWISQVSNFTQRVSVERYFNEDWMLQIKTQYEVEKSEKKYDSTSIKNGTIVTNHQNRWNEPAINLKYFTSETFMFFDLMNFEFQFKPPATLFKSNSREIEDNLKNRSYLSMGLDLASVLSSYSYWLNIIYRRVADGQIFVADEKVNYDVTGGDLTTYQFGLKTEFQYVALELEYKLIQKNIEYFRSNHYNYMSPEESISEIGFKLQHFIKEKMYLFARFYTIAHGELTFYANDIQHSRSPYSENGISTGLNLLF